MEIIKTNELSDKKINQIRYLFFDSFGKLPTKKDIMSKYSSSFLKFSFHCLFFDSEENLIGSFVFFPKVFKYKKKEIVGLLLLDTCFPYLGKVNPFLIKKSVLGLIDYCSKYLGQDCFLYGFPNQKIEKLWNSLLKWKYIDSIIPVFDLCPVLTIIFQKYNLSVTEKELRLKFNGIEKNPRFFSFGESFFKYDSNILNLWLIKKIFPIQIIDNLNVILKPRLITKNNILKIWRLFIPSILAANSFRKVKKWQFSLKNKKFPMYILDQNNIFNFKEIIIKPSFLLNDVP